MSDVILQMDFPYRGPWGEEMASALLSLAEDIASEAGLRWKIWTESPAAGRAGGIYLFESREQAADYQQRHTARLSHFGIGEVRAVIFDVNQVLSRIDRAPGF